MQVTEKWPLLARLQFAPRCIFSKSPCIFAKSREIPPGDGFADDWLVSQAYRFFRECPLARKSATLAGVWLRAARAEPADICPAALRSLQGHFAAFARARARIPPPVCFVSVMRSAVPRPLTLTAEVRLDEGKTSVFQQRTGRWLEIRRVHFQAPRLRLVRRAERKQDEAETDGYLGNVG